MTRVQANLLLLFVALLWGAGNVAQQMVLTHIGPLLANGLKCAIAIPVLLPLLMSRSASPRPLDAAGRWLGAIVVLTYMVGTTTSQVAFGHTTVSNAGFIMETATVLAPLFAWWLTRERPTGVIFLAAFITFCGVVNIGGGSLTSLNRGDAISLITAVSFAAWIICLGLFVQRYGRLGWLVLVQFSTTSVVCLLGAVALEPISAVAILGALPLLLFLGLVDSGLAGCLQGHAQRFTSPSEAAVLVSAEAVFGAILAYGILNERLGGMALFGAFLVMAGIVIMQTALPTAQKSKKPAVAF